MQSSFIKAFSFVLVSKKIDIIQYLIAEERFCQFMGNNSLVPEWRKSNILQSRNSRVSQTEFSKEKHPNIY